jgi:hypothetical protein
LLVLATGHEVGTEVKVGGQGGKWEVLNSQDTARCQTAEVAGQGKEQRRRLHKTQEGQRTSEFDKSNAEKPFRRSKL